MPLFVWDLHLIILLFYVEDKMMILQAWQFDIISLLLFTQLTQVNIYFCLSTESLKQKNMRKLIWHLRSIPFLIQNSLSFI